MNGIARIRIGRVTCEAPVLTAEDRIMRHLGYSTDDDTDGAA